MKISVDPKGYQGVNGHIGYILRKAQHATRLKIDAALKDLKVTFSQFVILSIFEFETNLHSADIARISMFSPQATNIVITKLEKAGYIERKPHETHGRVLTIEMTKRGKQLLKQCRQRVDAIEQQMVAGLSEQEEAVIRKWLIYCTRI